MTELLRPCLRRDLVIVVTFDRTDVFDRALTLGLLMSYIYMELLVEPELLTSHIYGPTFGIAESCLFLFAAQCFKIESMQKVILWHSCV
jgi:hypothetical protein